MSSDCQESISTVACDGIAHHALGGGSYAFKDDFPAYVRSLIRKSRRVEVNVVIQPNSSPHVGTLSSLGLAFVLAKRLKDLGSDVLVRCDLWDKAKGVQLEIRGMQYQRSLSDTGDFQKYLPDYEHVLEALAGRYLVPCKIRLEEDFLQQPGIPSILRQLISDRDNIASVLAPSTGKLAFRAPCPKCGLIEKYGILNEYSSDGGTVTFQCPEHGHYAYDVETETHKFQFNCQLLNLVMGFFYSQTDYDWVEICGSDYAGFWQEQLLWRFLTKPPVIVYTPLISDWSGLKVSKSLYLQDSAYVYLHAAGLGYLLSYAVLRRQGRNLNLLWDEIERWVDEPYRLFRGYSLHYLHLILSGSDVHHSTIHRTAGRIEPRNLQDDRPTTADTALRADCGLSFHMNSSSSDWPSDGEAF